MRRLLWTVAALPAVAACAPETVEDFAAARSVTGAPAYTVHGYTRPGERNPAFGEAYAQAFAREVCPGPATIVSVSTLPSRNAFAEFLRWDAIIECADAEAMSAAGQEPPATPAATPAIPPAAPPATAPAATPTAPRPASPPAAPPPAEPRAPGQPLQLVPQAGGS